VTDVRLNPVRLALAPQCYWIQFGIPDRFAFISPCPPRLQVEGTGVIIILVFVISQIVFYRRITVSSFS
jgi:hypothetical protein